MNHIYRQINKRLYYTAMLMIIAMMFIGLLVANPRMGEMDAGYILHGLLVVSLSVCLLLYPKYETYRYRQFMITGIAIYFYLLFLLYADTPSTFIFICLLPGLSILFFDSRLFYFTLLLNGIFISALFSYIIYVDQGNVYPFMEMDVSGNVINFVGSQVILFLIFKLNDARIKNQQAYYEQVQQSERLKTTGQLAAAVAHEIRNPLTVVKGFLQMYEKDQSLDHKVKRNFSLMINELDSAEYVISDFLSIAKSDSNQPLETVNVKVALEDVSDLLNSYGHLHSNEVELQVGDGCNISANTIEFKQLIINLIKNAIEASSLNDFVSVTAVRMNDHVDIRIHDQGCGMTEEEIKAIGTPFYSLKSKGTGLGLMICYNIVEKYNGAMEFRSVKGEGTTVHITFPAVENPIQ
ncbi:HAMP domain-containing histidine kinase [Bacillus shivajii]|uniref:sensor histidine kinase n=1 Tax=Bacillus shivajii TaxID=1983719 RepID=UPI001CF940F0|nr:HAMP domain-containing sensor histidine kinase [Bacillus shivajii]UCZ52681.1 HAMP domain-containing histidine kinase [Bacillus shivajii]